MPSVAKDDPVRYGEIVLAVVALVAAPVLAGCIGSSPNAPQGDPLGNDTLDPDERREATLNQTNNSSIAWEKSTPIDPNSSLHPHDYWGDRQEYVIIDGKTVPGFSDRYNGECLRRNGCLARGVRGVTIPIDENAERPEYVYPGTGRMEVTLEWTGGNPDAQPVMCVVNNGRDPKNPCLGWDESGSESVLNGTHQFSESGETWTIEGSNVMTPKTWDVPHTRKSRWRFAILAEVCTPDLSVQQCAAGNIEEFTVTATIHRGEDNLPLDPPHFDYFQGRSEIDILPRTQLSLPGCDTEQANTEPTRSWRRQTLWGEQDPICAFRGTFIKQAYVEDRSDAPVIPPTTEVVEITLDWSADNDIQLQLRYRDALDNWDGPWVAPEEGSTSCSGSSCTYTLVLERSAQADSLYAIRSAWEFAVFPGQDPQPPGQNLEVYASVKAVKNL